jgi:NADPH-dependent 2,4-dienoyl-CoA reductase/sulfur reductase-like enzyme/rhodanese-related sulfurtransferase
MNKRYVVIGGIAGGVSAAVRLRRLDEHAEITIIEKGPQVSFACCGLPYYIGGVIRKEFLSSESPEGFKQKYNIDVKLLYEAVMIDRHSKQVLIRNVQTGQELHIAYDKLVVATGSVVDRPAAFRPEMAGVFMMKGKDDMLALSDYINSSHARRAAVIGGGTIGMAAAENLSCRGIKTCVIEKGSHPLPFLDSDMARFAAVELENNGIALVTGVIVKAAEQQTDEGLRLELVDGRSIRADIALVCTGMRPDVELAQRAGLGVGITGGIIVDERQQTTDKDIYAVGDAVEVEGTVGGKVLLPMAAPAIRQGQVAADNICGIAASYRHTVSVRLVKLFDTMLAGAGLTEAQLSERDIRYEKVYSLADTHEHFFPGADTLAVKLLFDRKSGGIYGVQIAGRSGVDKRIDVIATAMQAGLTVDRLAELELAYMPLVSTTRDAVNVAGSMATDVMASLSEVVHWHDVEGMKDSVFLDVRSAGECRAGSIPDALHIPYEQLRSRIDELPSGRDIVVYSQNGRRGYLAERILKQRGFASKNLSGGYSMYSLFRGTNKDHVFLG